MENKFKVGDIIIYGSKDKSMYCNEMGMERLVTLIKNGCYHTEFLGNGNGIPMLWEDEL
jgi:hypothetical protein